MKVAIHQPNYLPWVGFFDKMDIVDTYVLLDTAMYTKTNYINRNKVLTLEGTKWLTVPIKGKRGRINELIIDNNQNWREHHWAIINNSYKGSLFWNVYCDGFHKIYRKNWLKVVDLNTALINHIKNLLEIDTKIIRESDFNLDFGSGNTRNIHIVKEVQCHTYVSGTGAKAYNDELTFKENNLQLIYQEFEHPIYPQSGEGFESHLSIIDMLFRCGPETIHLIRKGRKRQ